MLRLQGRSAEFSAEQAAFSDIGLQLESIRSAASGLTSSLFESKQVSSSNPNLLSATANSAAATGSWDLLVSRLASTSQVLSGGVATQDQTALGLTQLSFELGEGRLRDDVELSQLNGGFGIERGSIVVTNRSGTEAVVDLSQAATIGEVVDAINAAGLSVEASLQSGSLNLLDTSGGSGTFSVRSFNGSNTADDLGISSSIDSDAIEGDLIWSLAGNTELGVLRDGLGVRIQDGGLPDLTIQFSDGSPAITVDLGPSGTRQRPPPWPRCKQGSVKPLPERLNFACILGCSSRRHQPRRQDLVSCLNPPTLRLTFEVTGGAAEDLGLAGTSDGEYLVGDRVLGGLDGILLSSLSGDLSALFSGSFSVTDGLGELNDSSDRCTR